MLFRLNNACLVKSLLLPVQPSQARYGLEEKTPFNGECNCLGINIKSSRERCKV